MSRRVAAVAIVALALAGPAAAAPAPTVSTEPATSVTATAATLNGTVNPNGTATSWYFEYGTSTSYGSKTATQSAGSGTTTVSVSALVSGLQTGKLYHFRIVATSAGGTSAGADQTFTPTATSAAPGVATGPATGITNTAAKLNGTVNPNGATTSWYFEYGTSTSYGTKTAPKNAGNGTKPENVAASVSGLTASTTYHFRLVATNASGTSFGSDQTFTTTGPPAVQTGPAQSVTTTSAVLTGSVNPLGKSTSWHFDYGTTTAYGSHTASTSAGSGATPVAVSAPISGLAPATTYHYRLVATSSAGRTNGPDMTFTTAAAVTLRAAAHQVVYGTFVTLSGDVTGGQTGVAVTVLAERFGAAAFTPVGTVHTGSGGAWSLAVRPTIQTAYEASANGGTSTQVSIGVRPRVSLTAGRTTLSTRVTAARSFVGKAVQLQRLSNNRWVTVASRQLNIRSAATFPKRVLPRGRSTVRVAFSINQAGPGYLGGSSRMLNVRR